MWLDTLTDISDEVDTPLSHNYSLHEDELAYEYGASPAEIRYWDGSTILEITDNDDNDVAPSLYGNKIAWSGRPVGGADQIFYAILPSR